MLRCTLMSLGRIFVAALIFISAWAHLENPQSFVAFYTSSYETFYELVHQFGVSGLPSLIEVRIFVYLDVSQLDYDY